VHIIDTMDIYFVRISHEEVYTMTHITKANIDKWYEKNGDIAFYLDDTWDDAENYLIARDVTKLQCKKFARGRIDFITDYKQYTRDICDNWSVKRKLVFDNHYIYDEEVLPELTFRADNTLGKMVLKQSLIDDGLDDIFDPEWGDHPSPPPNDDGGELERENDEMKRRLWCKEMRRMLDQLGNK